MITRFKGPANRHKLVEALRQQQIVHNEKTVAEKLADVSQLVQFEVDPPDNVLINQEDADNDILLILAGKVSICVNGREVAIRQAGQHVGEMAMIDVSAARCATVAAMQQTVVARIKESDFIPIADEHTIVWRQLAVELANRLRERSKHVKAPNPRPVIFIGSSAEHRNIADEIRDGLTHDNMLPMVWADDLFWPSSTTIESLESELAASDFAVLVITPDDIVKSRKTKKAAPRDNVLWEHGFFTGGLGRHRVFIVRPRGVDIKLPSDLLGVTPLDYDPNGTAADLRARLGPATNGVRKAVTRLGPK